MSDTSTSVTSTIPETVRILGCNVQHGWRRDEAIAFIKSLTPAPDIILWQEAQPDDPGKGMASDAEVAAEALGMDAYENVLAWKLSTASLVSAASTRGVRSRDNSAGSAASASFPSPRWRS
ncbi:hypothetical protein [Kitasatospora sp. NPDC058218]|uniref:hypothetical protein n=1 Tax=Kitasatospora sp. NPDC058218 TaxID=3346385 RepID=UPI0036DD63B4